MGVFGASNPSSSCGLRSTWCVHRDELVSIEYDVVVVPQKSTICRQECDVVLDMQPSALCPCVNFDLADLG
jgi:hypothetical protein